MKKIGRKMLLFLLTAFIVLLAGCGEKEIIPIGESQIKSDLEVELKKEFEFDSMKNFTVQPADLSQEDVDFLKEKFTSPLPFSKQQVSFEIESTEVKIKAFYNLIFAYNEEWKLVSMKRTREPEWQQEAKSSVSIKQIIDDLKSLEFEGFKKGFVGSEESTTVKIISRNSDLAKGQDNIILESTVKTDFATYTFSSTAIYYFMDGKWKMAQIQPDNIAAWTINYYEDRKPEAPSVDSVFERLTNPENTLTYITNPAFIQKSYISEPSEKVSQNAVIFDYIYVVTYKNIGDFQYIVSIPFNWIGGDWAIGDAQIKYIKSSLKPALGVWKANNEKYFVFNKVEKDILSGTFYTQNGDISEEYKISCKIDVPLRDNDWDVLIESVDIPDGVESSFDITAMTLNLEKGILVANNQQYIHDDTVIEDGQNLSSAQKEELPPEDVSAEKPEGEVVEQPANGSDKVDSQKSQKSDKNPAPDQKTPEKENKDQPK